MAELSHRARLYKKIEDSLSEDDVRSLRAMLVSDEHLGQARVENATPLEMFNMLEADNKIGKGNLALLVDLLKALGKAKLAEEAEDVAKREGTRQPFTVEDIVTCLKDLYARENARVRPLPWCEDLSLSLEEVYTNLQHQRRDDKGRFEDTDTIDTNMTPDQLWSFIQENQNDILFILDGLDELSQAAREGTDVVALIQGKILRNCHVLVTSRPYHCVKDLEKCDEFYKIVGYSKNDSVQFIQKYFSETPESARVIRR
ncbi:CIITA [Branchiostoma lanceolatum]|uniref:CIITA protein n=1 Tax=Branchiostoma lanceolatum TaxID=7740 RepID=A0A8K0EU77_BRALA|nr:CIITA [Branchiostoma lanceolatum]